MKVLLENTIRKILKVTIDTTHVCNLKCDYCLQGWKSAVRLPAEKIRDAMAAAEQNGVLEVFLSGAETTLHPELEKIFDYTHVLQRTGASLITNGTRITPDMILWLKRSNISRICLSIDGPDAESHNSARGKNFDLVLKALYMLQETGKSICVLSVAHQGNFHKLTQLSEFLAANKLANQHNITAVSRSGLAIDEYDRMRLQLRDFYRLQEDVDTRYESLKRRGVHLIFTSYWWATGKRSPVRSPRELTLFELSEQLKDCNLLVRVGGNVQITSAAWAREFLIEGVMGNIMHKPAQALFDKAEKEYRKRKAMQLPRELEAQEKYALGGRANQPMATDKDGEPQHSPDQFIPVTPIEQFDLLKQQLTDQNLMEIAAKITADSDRFRTVRVAKDIYVLFDMPLCHVTILKKIEIEKLDQYMERTGRKIRHSSDAFPIGVQQAG